MRCATNKSVAVIHQNMHILPNKNEFAKRSKSSTRVPVCGVRSVPKLSPALLYQELFKDEDESFLLESGRGPESTSRYSFMGTSNSRSITIQNNTSCLIKEQGLPDSEMKPLEGLDLLNFNEGIDFVDYLPHFWGGWVGVLGYELAGLFENLPQKKVDDFGIPHLYMIQVNKLLVYDHKESILKYIVSHEGNGEYLELANEVDFFWKRIDKFLARSASVRTPTIQAEKSDNGLQSNMSKQEYVDSVQRAKKLIEEGDIYQANLSQRFETAYPGEPFDLFMRLRSVNPSPFSGYLKFKDFSIVSSSPERLIKVENTAVETRPIAGTRPRSSDPEADKSLSLELLLNEKERAEHLMLVDLERNDLGRICNTGSVHVSELMFLEQYSHVSHIVSNIKGELKPKVSVKEILRAVFPGGTITGCPKVRCMEIISELEHFSRGPYCGSFGYIGFSSYIDLNIIIRSILLKDGKACFNVGAGIVADSNPEKEYLETLDKAQAMIQVLSQQYIESR
jgi:aminodeoxychorismate synthase component I